MTLCNRILEYRERAGVSRTELSQCIGITRQALGLIETNKVIPSTLVSIRLSRFFGVPVDELFFEESDSEIAFVWPEDNIQAGDRIVIANIDGRKVARLATGMYTYRTQALTAIAKSDPDEGQIRIVQPSWQTVTDGFVMAGCDLGLGLFAEHLQCSSMKSSSTVLWLGLDNTQALLQLAKGMINVAAVHFPHSVTAPYNSELARIRFADWEVGWIVKRGNPLNFRGVDDLREGKVRIVNRPLGSGVRDLLDELVKTAGIATSLIPQYDWAVPGHRQVAETIATGMADIGIATASAAAMLHLDFLSIRRECCELWFPKERVMAPEVQKMLDILNSDVFRWDLERFGPCDVTRTGQEVEV